MINPDKQKAEYPEDWKKLSGGHMKKGSKEPAQDFLNEFADEGEQPQRIDGVAQQVGPIRSESITIRTIQPKKEKDLAPKGKKFRINWDGSMTEKKGKIKTPKSKASTPKPPQTPPQKPPTPKDEPSFMSPPEDQEIFLSPPEEMTTRFNIARANKYIELEKEQADRYERYIKEKKEAEEFSEMNRGVAIGLRKANMQANKQDIEDMRSGKYSRKRLPPEPIKVEVDQAFAQPDQPEPVIENPAAITEENTSNWPEEDRAELRQLITTIVDEGKKLQILREELAKIELEEKMAATKEITKPAKKRERKNTKKEVAIETFPRSVVEDAFNSFFQPGGVIKEIENLDIKEAGNTLIVTAELAVEKGKMKGPIKVTGVLDSFDNKLRLKFRDIEANKPIKGQVEKTLLVKMDKNKIIENIQNSIAKERGIKKIWIADGQLKVIFK